MMAVTLTPDAEFDLNRYLRKVRAALRAHPSVDANDVERDVRSHIESELEETASPVTSGDLRAVLDRLGSPGQWVPLDDLPLWRRLAIRLQAGPEDWRLAYLTFGCFIVGPLLPPIGPAFFFGSFFLARATLALLADHDEPAGARRWLLYPPLIVVYVAVAATLLAVPTFGIAVSLDEFAQEDLERMLGTPLWSHLAAVGTAALGVWWVILGLGVARFSRAVPYVFYPFAEWFTRRHAFGFALVGLLVALAGGAALLALS